MRLSYLRYALKTATDPQKLFEQESEELRSGQREGTAVPAVSAAKPMPHPRYTRSAFDELNSDHVAIPLTQGLLVS